MVLNRSCQFQLQPFCPDSHVYVFHIIRFCGVYTTHIARILPVRDRGTAYGAHAAFWSVPSWRHQSCLERASFGHKCMGSVPPEPAQIAKSDQSAGIQSAQSFQWHVQFENYRISMHAFSCLKWIFNSLANTVFSFGSLQKSH